MANRGLNFFQHCLRNFSSSTVMETVGVKRTDLEAKKYGFHRQAAFRGRNAYVGEIVTRQVFAFCAKHHGDDKRLAIDGVDGKNQYRPASRLFTALRRIEIHHE